MAKNGNGVNHEKILLNEEARVYLEAADNNFAAIGYKEHGLRHANFTANASGDVIKSLGFGERDCELAKIAGYLHDVGNAIAQEDHAQNGAILALEILEKAGMSYDEIFKIISAVGSHEDRDMEPSSHISAAVILGDKSDVHHTRVRAQNLAALDMHGRVNYACQNASLKIDGRARVISLKLDINTSICPVMDYFEIFLSRTKFCRKASKALGCEFELFINNDKFI